MHHETIRRTLAQGAGDSPDARAIAESVLGVWHQMAHRLVPVIGTRGVDAVLNRSLYLTSKTYPWLAIACNGENSALLIAGLRECIASRETVDATEASQTLLANFTELLATLIGVSLTLRLLAPVWVPPAPDSEQEKAK